MLFLIGMLLLILRKGNLILGDRIKEKNGKEKKRQKEETKTVKRKTEPQFVFVKKHHNLGY